MARLGPCQAPITRIEPEAAQVPRPTFAPWAAYLPILFRASCAWVESERDSRISEILIQPVGGRRPAGDGKAVFARLARPGD